MSAASNLKTLGNGPRLVRSGGQWICSRFVRWDSGLMVTADTWGEGPTPKAAFDAWAKANRKPSAWWWHH